MTAIADVSYAPGTLTAVAGDRCWMLIDATPDSPAVDWLWQQLGQRARPEVVLTGLLGAGFAGATEFALLYQDGDAHRLFCRGAVAATVQGIESAVGGVSGGPAEAKRIDGSGLLTWREHLVPGTVRRVLLGVPPADGALRLPATSGVLLASCMIIDLTDAAVRESMPRDPVPVIQAVSDADSPIDAIPLAASAGMPPPTRVIRPDVVADGMGAAGQAESALHPGTMATPPLPSIAEGTGSPSAIRPLPAAADGSVSAVAEEYDFLWGSTQTRSVADAAIRASDADGVRPPAFSASGASDGVNAGTGMAMIGPPPPPPPPVAPSPLPAAGVLIDAMPWGPGPTEPDENGENGFTVKRGNLAGPDAWAARPPDKIGPAVPALLCPAGHVNPPSEARCRRCGAPLPPDPVVVPRPVLGVLRLSVGDMISLDRDVIMGRNPKSDFPGADGEERPHVVKLPSEGDISRTHVRVTLDGWHVLVTDLNSTNGTLVTLPGREPEQLRPGQPMPIQPGTVVTLAVGVDFRYEVSG